MKKRNLFRKFLSAGVAACTIVSMSAVAAPSKWTPLIEEQTFETETIGETPTGWTLTGAGAACLVTEADKKTGTKAILLENTSSEEPAVLTLEATGRGLYKYARVEMYAWFNLVDLSEGGKLNFTVTNTSAEASATGGDFTTLEKGWQKAFCYHTSEYEGKNAEGAKYSISVTLTGIGKVYLDDITFGDNHGMVSNGDFEAQFREGMPGDDDLVWKHYGLDGWGSPQENPSLVKEENGNTYLKFGGYGTSTYIYSRFRNLDANQLYKLTYRTFTESTNNANCVIYEAGAVDDTPSNSRNGFDSLGRVWSPKCSDGWVTHTVYFVNKRNQDNNVGGGYHTDIKFAVNSSGVVYGGIDDVTLEAVQEGVTFTRDGQPLTACTSGEVDITYIYPETDFTAPSSKTMVAAVYRYENDVKKLCSVQLFSATASTEKVANAYINGTHEETGFLPLTFPTQLTVPETEASESYSVEVFIWDGTVAANSLLSLASRYSLPAQTE